jgi:hypothetical protein
VGRKVEDEEATVGRNWLLVDCVTTLANTGLGLATTLAADVVDAGLAGAFFASTTFFFFFLVAVGAGVSEVVAVAITIPVKKAKTTMNGKTEDRRMFIGSKSASKLTIGSKGGRL